MLKHACAEDDADNVTCLTEFRSPFKARVRAKNNAGRIELATSTYNAFAMY